MAADLDVWLREAERQIDLDAWEPPKKKSARRMRKETTFAEYSTEWVRNRRHPDGTPIEETSKQKHRENLRLYLIPAFGDKALGEISYKMVKDWYDNFTPVRKFVEVDVASRRGAVYRTFKAIMHTAATEPIDDDGHTLIDKSPAMIPAPKAEAKHEALIPTDQQLFKIYWAMPGWIRLSVLLAGKTGLREGEVLALTVECVHFDTHQIKIERAAKTVTYEDGTKVKELGKTKTKSSVRMADYPSFLDPFIKEHIETYTDGKPDSLLFKGTITGKIVSGQTLRNALNRTVQKVTPELTGMHFHDLRDTGLTAFMAAGGTLGETMGQGGHTSMKIASRYQKHLKSHISKVMDEMNKQHEEETHPTKNDSSALATVLSVMQPDAIVETLKKMDDSQKKKVIAALPEETQSQVLMALV